MKVGRSFKDSKCSHTLEAAREGLQRRAFTTTNKFAWADAGFFVVLLYDLTTDKGSHALPGNLLHATRSTFHAARSHIPTGKL